MRCALFVEQGMDMMKGVLCCLCVFFVISVTVIPSFGITMDGIVGAKEWGEATSLSLIGRDDKSNCDVVMTALLYLVKEEDRSIYFGIKYCCEDMRTENTGTAVELSFDGVYCATLYANGEADVNYDVYDAEAVFSCNEKLSETYCEIRAGFKYGVPKETTVGIRISDYKGRPSNYYEFTVEGNEVYQTESTVKEERVTTAPHGDIEDEKTSSDKQKNEPTITASRETVAVSEKETQEKEHKQAAIVKDTTAIVTKRDKKEKTTADVSTTSRVKEIGTENVSKESETYVQRSAESFEIGKTATIKTVGFCAATALVVGAIFTGIVSAFMKPKKDIRSEYDDWR